MLLDLKAGALVLSLQHWTCLFGSWAEEILLVSGPGSWVVGLVTPAMDLSFGSWAFDPASFLIRNYDCFWAWTLGL